MHRSTRGGRRHLTPAPPPHAGSRPRAQPQSGPTWCSARHLSDWQRGTGSGTELKDVVIHQWDLRTDRRNTPPGRFSGTTCLEGAAGVFSADCSSANGTVQDSKARNSVSLGCFALQNPKHAQFVIFCGLKFNGTWSNFNCPF